MLTTVVNSGAYFINSMETVTKLTSQVTLPMEFVQLYISTCITICTSFKDKTVQKSRAHRFFCTFVQHLINIKIIDSKFLQNYPLLWPSLEQFCIHNSQNNKEETNLYQLLRSITL